MALKLEEAIEREQNEVNKYSILGKMFQSKAEKEGFIYNIGYHNQIVGWLRELQAYRNHAGVLFYKTDAYVNDEPILKTKDKNGMCSFFGFKKVEVEDDSKTSEETTE